MMYSNLRAEMSRYGVSVSDLAKACDIAPTTLYSRLKGTLEFRLNDMEKIKKYLDSVSGKEFALEYLFSREM